MKQSEEEYVNEGLTPEEISAMSGEREVVDDGPEIEDAPLAVEQPAAVEQPEVQADKPQMVDVRALQEARAEARQAKEESARVKAEQQLLSERLALINERLKAKDEPPPPAAPTKDEDYLGFVDHKLETVEQRLQRYEDAEKQREAGVTAEREFEMVVDRAGNYLAAATAQKPELREAFDFAVQGMRSQIAARFGDRLNTDQAARNEAEQIWKLSWKALAERMPADPSAAAEYVLSNARYYGYGYQTPQPSPAPVPVTQQKPTPQELAERQERHMSLSSIAGGEAPQALSLESIAKMSASEFNKLVEKIGDEGVDKLMGAV